MQHKLVFDVSQVPLLVLLLSSGHSPVRAAACSTLKSLALTPSLRPAIAEADAIKPLVKLLRDSACRGKAAGALANLTLDCPDNCREVGAASCIEQLIRLARVKEDECMVHATATMEHLAGEPECRTRFVKAGAVKPLVRVPGGLENLQLLSCYCSAQAHVCARAFLWSKISMLGRCSMISFRVQ